MSLVAVNTHKHNFECPACLILTNDPLNDVIGILVEPSVLLSEQEYPFKLTADQNSRMQEDPNVGVEIRTIKCDGEHFYEQTWPDKCTIKLNGELIKEVKPLHQNSSLKKRKDEKIFSRKHVRSAGNTLWISFANVQDGKNTKPKQDPKYVFVVVLVRRVSVEELSLRIRNMNTLSVEQCKEFIKEKFLQQRDLEINEIKVNLIDNISFTTIKHPARGLFCDHVPCFSLDYFLLSMENNYTRKWACPICKKRCNKFVVDSYAPSATLFSFFPLTILILSVSFHTLGACLSFRLHGMQSWWNRAPHSWFVQVIHIPWSFFVPCVLQMQLDFMFLSFMP